MLEAFVILACIGGFLYVVGLLSRERFGHARVRGIAHLIEENRNAEALQAVLPEGKDRAVGLCLQGQASFNEGDADGALALVDQAIALGDSPRGMLEFASMMKSEFLSLLGRYDDAVAVAFAFARSDWAEDLRAQVAVNRGEVDLAEALLSREQQLYTHDAIRLRRLATLRLFQGAYREADALAARAVEYLTRPRERPVAALANIFLLRAEVTLSAGARDVARAHLDAALAEARRLTDQNRPGNIAFAATAASIAGRLDDVATATQALAKAEELAAGFAIPPLEARLAAARGDVAYAAGAPEQAKAHILRAIELHERLGERPYVDRLRARLDSRS